MKFFYYDSSSQNDTEIEKFFTEFVSKDFSRMAVENGKTSASAPVCPPAPDPIQAQRQNSALCACDIAPLKNIIFSNDKNLEMTWREVLAMLRPYDMENARKVRLGGNRDGGYVMIDPGQGGIAWSLGISSYSPWDMDMAERDFQVYQFDGTIQAPPNTHPNLHFYKKNLTGKAEHAENEMTISEIEKMLGQENEKNIILQMDIESAEWEIFDNLSENDLSKFSQIIGEFHLDFSSYKIEYYKNIFRKLLKTHIPVHFHYNNNGYIIKFSDFLLSHLFEISFVRRDLGKFIKSDCIYPTSLDRKNVPSFPEIYIGSFNVIENEINTANLKPAQTATPSKDGDNVPPKNIPAALEKQYTLNGKIPVIPYYFNNTVSSPIHITSQIYENTLKKIKENTFSYYGPTLQWLKSALEKYSPAGKTVIIYGLADCNCDALAIYYGAKKVIVTDYNPPVCDHPLVDVLTIADLEKSDIKADMAISISSFEHAGLGRYGDPLDPEGDLRSMERVKKNLKNDGTLFLSVPVGADCIAWNAHRI